MRRLRVRSRVVCPAHLAGCLPLHFVFQKLYLCYQGFDLPAAVGPTDMMPRSRSLTGDVMRRDRARLRPWLLALAAVAVLLISGAAELAGSTLKFLVYELRRKAVGLVITHALLSGRGVGVG